MGKAARAGGAIPELPRHRSRPDPRAQDRSDPRAAGIPDRAGAGAVFEPEEIAADQPIRTMAPPSTGSETPVMKPASSEARNSPALATSHAAPIPFRTAT